MYKLKDIETTNLNLLRRKKNAIESRSDCPCSNLAHAENKVYSLPKRTRAGNSAQRIVSFSTPREFRITILTTKLKVFPKKIFVPRSERHKFFFNCSHLFSWNRWWRVTQFFSDRFLYLTSTKFIRNNEKITFWGTLHFWFAIFKYSYKIGY